MSREHGLICLPEDDEDTKHAVAKVVESGVRAAQRKDLEEMGDC